jgi:hypothetical protein
MEIKTKWNVGDEVYFLTEDKSIIAVTVTKIVVFLENDATDQTVMYEGNCGGTVSRCGLFEQHLMSREEAIKKFDEMRSEEFLKLFG